MSASVTPSPLGTDRSMSVPGLPANNWATRENAKAVPNTIVSTLGQGDSA
jgi:hypothetical protein